MKFEDDSYNSETESEISTASLASSIDEYIFENGGLLAISPTTLGNERELTSTHVLGRRYHSYYGSDKNLHPTDEREKDRLDLHHEIFLQLLEGELYKAPIGQHPQQILDIGTGTGIWAIDMADKYATLSSNLSGRV